MAKKRRGGREGREAAKRRGRPGGHEDRGGKGRSADHAGDAGPARKGPLVSLGGMEKLITGDHAWLAFFIFIVVLWLAFYHDVFFMGKTLVSPDAVAPAGFVKVGKEALEGGVYPLWNPYIFCGMPSFSSLSYNPYIYPVGMAFKVLWPLMRLPMMWLLIYYLAGGLSLFLLLRKMPLPSAAAAFGATAFMFTPNLVAVGAFGHGSQLMASMYVPIIFLMTHRLLNKGGAVYAAGLALLFGLQLLRGHVQISYYTAIMIGIMTIYWTLRNFPKRGLKGSARPLGLAALAVVLALGLASVLYIPVHNYTDLSIRSAGEHGGLDISKAGMWSLSPKEMSTFLFPAMLGFGGKTYWGTMPFTDYPNGYMGILTLLLALYAVFKLRRNPTVVLLAVLAVVALLMSFGRHLGPLYEMAHRWLPFFNKFRVPVMVIVLLQFAVACLAGYGVSLIFKNATGDGKRTSGGVSRNTMLWAMGAVGAAIVLFFAAGSGLREAYTALVEGARGDAFARIAGPAAFESLRLDVLVAGIVVLAGMALILGFRMRIISYGILAMGFICLCCLDLWRVDYRLMEPNIFEQGSALKTIEEDPVAIFLAEDEDFFRVYPLGRMFQDNTLNAHKVASVGGYHAAKPKLWDEWANAHTDEELWRSTGLRSLPVGRDQRLPAGAMMTSVRRMLGVKYVIAEAELQAGSGLQPVFRERAPGDPRGPGRTVYETTDWLPKAFCVDQIRRVDTGRDALREILTASFDPEAYAIVEDEVRPAPAVAGSTTVASYGVNHVDVDVISQGPTFLVVGDLYMEGWKAYVDGENVPLHKANYLIRGVAVPAGSHRVRLEYFDPGLALGLKLGAGCAIFIISMALPAMVRGSRSGKRRRQAL